MSTSPRFRHVHATAGTFVLVVVGLLVAAIIITGRSHRWFSPMGKVTLQFPQEGSLGLKEGADVLILGTVVGSVDTIVPGKGYYEPMTAQLKIQQDFMRYVRMDSAAFIREKLGIGDSFIEIKKGSETSKPFLKDSPPLIVSSERGTQKIIEDTIDQLRAEAVPAVRQLRVAIDELTKLEIHVNTIADGIQHGSGPIAKLIYDPQMGHDLTETVPKVNGNLDALHHALDDVKTSTAVLPAITASLGDEAKSLQTLLNQTQKTIAQLDPIMGDIQKTTSSLPGTTRALEESVKALPGTVIQMQETLLQIQRLVEAAQKTWLLRSYVDQGNQGKHISPSQVTGSGD